MPNYEKSKPEVGKLVSEIMEKYHGGLFSAGVTVDCLHAFAKTDDNGDATGPALKLHGHQCATVVKIVSTKDRAKGMADAEITFDGDHYDELGADELEALIDHELTHLELSLDDAGAVRRDDQGRPKLRMRLHDHQFGWFDTIAARHGAASLEVQQARSFADSFGQMYFGFVQA